MALIIPPYLVKRFHGIKSLDPITFDEFEERKKNFKKHNKKIGDRKGVDLSKEPEKLYFDKDDVLSVLHDCPTYLTFMFACEDVKEPFKGLRIVMCGMHERGTPISEDKIFEAYKKGGSRKVIDKHKFDEGRDLCEKRYSFYVDLSNWRGVAHDDPLPFGDIITDNRINRIAVYMADKEEKYNVMLALSTGNFKDEVPTSSSSEYKVYNNGNQCCQD